MDGLRRRIRGTSGALVGTEVDDGVGGRTLPFEGMERGERGLRGGDGRSSGREIDICQDECFC